MQQLSQNHKSKRCKKRAQSILEFAVLIVCIVAALLSMKIYLKRGISGRLREASDEIGQQYDPRHTFNPPMATGVRGETKEAGMFKAIERDVTRDVKIKTFREPGSSEPKVIVERTETINKEENKEWGVEQVEALQKDIF